MPHPRKPNALKALEGTARADRHQEEVPLESADDLSPPVGLSEDPHALRLWNEYAHALHACNVLAAVDKNPLALLCSLEAILIRSIHAGDMPNAAIVSQWRMMLNEFGLTPSSRSKPTPLSAKQKKDPTARFFKAV